MLQDKIFRLKGKVMHYAWGGYDFIPGWLGIVNDAHKPFAEYWMGTHPLASSDIETDSSTVSLQQLVQENADAVIGPAVKTAFRELPYLFKVQDVKDMLSIQVHPSKTEAEKGFAAEEAAGIPANAPNRNYKDKNHKPEVLVALSEFWLLHGFLQPELLKKVLESTPEFHDFTGIFENEGYRGLYKFAMELPRHTINKMLQPLVQRELQNKQQNKLTKADPGWWVAKLYAGTGNIENIDPGVFSIYFFNIVRVNPGEGVFQGAGVPHAYLEGQTMELMANSDNVLRGGLTPKHIDIPELLKHTIFEGITPNIMKGVEKQQGEKYYPCPVADFGISKIELKAGETLSSAASSLEIIVVMEGGLTLSDSKDLPLRKGEAAAIFYDESYTISTSGGVLAYKAFVP